MINNAQNTLLSETTTLNKSCLLAQWGLILVEGLDATNFLQNQLSNSVQGLMPCQPNKIAQNSDSARLVGYCNPKGRLLASAWIGLFPRQESVEDRFLLFISKDIAASIAKRLSMYVLRSKVRVLDISNEWNVSCSIGVGNLISEFIPGENQLCLRMPDVLAGGNTYSRLLIANPTENTSIDQEILNSWNYLEVISAIPRIVKATQEQFVPQMINFESVAGIDFKKGCYPGQEIVARSQYRGAIKRRLHLAHASIDSLALDFIAPGTDLFHSDDPEQPAGMVVLSSLNPLEHGRVDFQIECKLDALEAGELRLGNIHGPVLQLDILPYQFLEI